MSDDKSEVTKKYELPHLKITIVVKRIFINRDAYAKSIKIECVNIKSD